MIIAWVLGYFLIVTATEVEAQRGSVHFGANVDDTEQNQNNYEEIENGNNDQQQYQQTRQLNTNTIPGVPGVDYPTYETIPKTSFTCQGKVDSAYYADTETQCQVFHICQSGGHKNSFLCPTGSIFNQKYSVCDWWYSFDCDSINEVTPLNFDIQKTDDANENYQNELVQYQNAQDQYNNYNPNIYSDLSIASSGGNNPKDEQPAKSVRKERNNFKKITRNTISQQENNRTSSPTTTKPYVKKSLIRKVTAAATVGETSPLTKSIKINHQSNLNKQQLIGANNENKSPFQYTTSATGSTSNNDANLTIRDNSTNINGGEYTNHQQQHPNPYRNGLNGYLNGKINGAKPIAFLLSSTSGALLASNANVGGNNGDTSSNTYNGDNSTGGSRRNIENTNTINNYNSNYNSDEQRYGLVT